MQWREHKGALKHAITGLTLAMAAFQIYTAVAYPLSGFMQPAAHLMFALLLTFLLIAPHDGARGKGWLIVDFLLVAASVAFSARVLASGGAIPPEVTAALSPLDTVLAACAVVALLEATRRSVGWSLMAVVLVCILYAWLGAHIPGPAGHSGYSLKRILSTSYLTVEGMYGTPLQISATTIFMLVLFGAVALRLGTGQVLMALANALLGGYRGGPAKMAVGASALFGTIVGSGIASTATMGVFTIPLMLRVGYRPNFAGAVEASSSIGGQLMPPVMGAAAFIMADLLGVPYSEIALAALIPAILYFVAQFVTVDLEAAKHRLQGLPREERPGFGETLRDGWLFLIAPVVLIYAIMVMELSPQVAALWGLITVILVYLIEELRHRRNPSLSSILAGFEDGGRSAIFIAIATAAIGIIIGMIDLSGIGLKLSTLLIDLSGGNLYLLMILTMIASIILGTGLPTVPTYLILALLAAPAMIKLGVDPLAAHLFVFYFGIISDLTPPVAISCVIAAGIAGGDPLKTSLLATRLAIASFIVPFVFVLQPALLLKGPWLEVVQAVITSLLGLSAYASALSRWLFIRLHRLEQIVLFAGGTLLLAPSAVTDAIGFMLIVSVVVSQVYAARREGREQVEPR